MFQTLLGEKTWACQLREHDAALHLWTITKQEKDPQHNSGSEQTVSCASCINTWCLLMNIWQTVMFGVKSWYDRRSKPHTEQSSEAVNTTSILVGLKWFQNLIWSQKKLKADWHNEDFGWVRLRLFGCGGGGAVSISEMKLKTSLIKKKNQTVQSELDWGLHIFSAGFVCLTILRSWPPAPPSVLSRCSLD